MGRQAGPESRLGAHVGDAGDCHGRRGGRGALWSLVVAVPDAEGQLALLLGGVRLRGTDSARAA